MKEHEPILVLFLVSAAVIVMVFYFVYRTTLPPAADGEGIKSPTQKRLYVTSFLALLFAILLFYSLPKSPYFLFSDQAPAKTVHVLSRQFFHFMSLQDIDPQDPKIGEPIELPLNEPVEFQVTSSDVNHGFGIYNDKAELVIQVQAMPGYVNHLRWKFTEPGTYNVLCLEFCGSAHAFMRTSFTVK